MKHINYSNSRNPGIWKKNTGVWLSVRFSRVFDFHSKLPTTETWKYSTRDNISQKSSWGIGECDCDLFHEPFRNPTKPSLCPPICFIRSCRTFLLFIVCIRITRTKYTKKLRYTTKLVCARTFSSIERWNGCSRVFTWSQIAGWNDEKIKVPREKSYNTQKARRQKKMKAWRSWSFSRCMHARFPVQLKIIIPYCMSMWSRILYSSIRTRKIAMLKKRNAKEQQI